MSTDTHSGTQILKLNPGFNPASVRPPPNVRPPPGRQGETHSKICIGCQEFFDKPPRVWTGNSSHFADLVEEAKAKAVSGGYNTDEQDIAQGCSHTLKIRDIIENFHHGRCHFCVLIGLKARDDNDLGKAFAIAEDEWQPQQQQQASLKEPLLMIAITESSRDYFNVMLLFKLPTRNTLVRTFLNIVTQPGVDMALAGGPLGPSTSSSQTFASINGWLQTCLDTHSDCRPIGNFDTVRPTRLIDIHDFERTGVVAVCYPDQHDNLPPYLVLSHCWGDSKKVLLTQKSRATFEAGIEVQKLAPTFRDAFEIAHRLGFRYIWIDCLCILQDSLDDWSIEAAKMAGIYGNAAFCIAASDSADSDGGCFRQRQPLEVQPLRFEKYPFIPNWEVKDTSKPLLIASRAIQDAWNWCRGPMDSRGWILQEQLLAARTLHFAHDQVFWECRTTAASEIWPQGLPQMYNGPTHNGKSMLIYDKTRMLPGEASWGYAPDDPKLLYRRWTDIVMWYTARSLTKPTKDKLLALLGIANVMSSLMQDRFVAGLWEGDLLEGLAWVKIPDSSVQSRPLKDRAPSWSWASIDGSVRYFNSSKHSRDMEALIDPASTVLRDLSTTTMTNNVTTGRLSLHGLIRRSIWKYDGQKDTKRQLVDLGSQGWLDDEIRLYPDTTLLSTTTTTTTTAEETIYLFQLFRSHSLDRHSSPVGRNCLHGLVLTVVEESSSEYCRLGYWIAQDFGYTKTYREGWSRFEQGWTRADVHIV